MQLIQIIVAIGLFSASSCSASHPMNWFSRLNQWTQAERNYGQQFWQATWPGWFSSGLGLGFGFGMPAYAAEDLRAPFTLFGGAPPFSVYQYYIPNRSYFSAYESPVERAIGYIPSPVVDTKPAAPQSTAQPSSSQDLSSFQTIAPETSSHSVTTESSKPSKPAEQAGPKPSVMPTIEASSPSESGRPDVSTVSLAPPSAVSAAEVHESSSSSSQVASSSASPAIATTQLASISSLAVTEPATELPVTLAKVDEASAPSTSSLDAADSAGLAGRESRASYQENLEPNRRRRAH